ncbi:winged helix-turn-helix transcriptional regulator [Dyadobacter fermentans]|uniref:Transcriptional regulator, HxlR family n=1 Tax=Dyadobacter fermentans (strain ATCC 700827 / DSM 18053 / CIP 107007 / KCTC 52180 / NS114) TaxID=471854 RepID=C6VXF5_DYAFD|nr:helix-turn-helix domain-containing protein [Dyadobacter fermentans]ACT93298.1 transcriptional regulator, HxlR family [Dyadobacter fermentans DSM 18053]
MPFTHHNGPKPTPAQCYNKLNAAGDALYVIGGKWRLRIIIALAEGHKRFNEIQRAIHGISARVLSNELKELEINGFLIRKVYTDFPVSIEYELTPYSDTLSPVIESLISWGEMHRQTIMHSEKPEAIATPVLEEIL